MIQTGNVDNLSRNYRDWFLGSFIDDELPFNTKNSKDFEIKWGKREKGYFARMKETPLPNPNCKSMGILIYGELRYGFILENTDQVKDFILRNEGDYVFWTPDKLHEVEFLKDSLVITVRWY